MTTKTFTSGNWVGGVWSPVGDPTAADDCQLNGSSGNCVITAGAVGRSLDCTGYTNTLSGSQTLAIGDGTTGNVLLVAGMGYTATGTMSLVSTASGNTFTSAGKTIASIVASGAGAWTQQDALTLSGAFTLAAGTWTTGGNAITTTAFGIGGSTTRTLNLGASVVTCTGLTPLSAVNGRTSVAAGITLNAGTSVIACTDTSASGKTIANADLTWYIFRLTMGGSGAFTFNGAGTFYAIQTTGTPTAITIKFTISLTITLTSSTPLPSGTAGNLVTLNSTSAGTVATLNLSGQTISVDYMSIKDITVTNGTLYAGVNSTDGGNNTGVVFTSPPTRSSQINRSLIGVG